MSEIKNSTTDIKYSDMTKYMLINLKMSNKYLENYKQSKLTQSYARNR